MIIFTPDVAYNTDRYRCIHTTGEDARLHLTDGQGNEDYIQFDSPRSAVEAFDAYVNGAARGCRTLLLQEVYDHMRGGMRLVAEYDRKDYRTETVTTEDGRTAIADPRGLPLAELAGALATGAEGARKAIKN